MTGCGHLTWDELGGNPILVTIVSTKKNIYTKTFLETIDVIVSHRLRLHYYYKVSMLLILMWCFDWPNYNVLILSFNCKKISKQTSLITLVVAVFSYNNY